MVPCLIALSAMGYLRPAIAQPDAATTAGVPTKAAQMVNEPIHAVAIRESGSFPHRKFSLNVCFEKADSSNKEILVSAAALPIAQAAVVIARAIPNPAFNMTYGFGPAWRIIVAGNNQQVGWTEEVQVAGRRTKKTAVANANLLQTAFNLQAVRFDVHNRIRRAYSELVAASAYANLIEAQTEIAQNLLDISQKRYTAGKAPGAEVLQAKLAVMQYDTLRNQALGRLLQDSATMSQLLGEKPQHQEIIDVDQSSMFRLQASKTVLVPDIDRGIPSLRELLPAAWFERNDLKASIQQAYANRKALTLAKTQRIPDPFIGFNYLFSTYKSSQQRFFTGSVPFQPGYLLTVQEEMPIWYHYQGQVNQAEATWNQQKKQVELSQAQIAMGIISAYEVLTSTRENIGKYQQELLPDAEKVANLARRAYQLGKTDLATAILAQQQYQQMRSSYFDAIVAYQNAWADLEKAVGVPLK